MYWNSTLIVCTFDDLATRNMRDETPLHTMRIYCKALNVNIAGMNVYIVQTSQMVKNSIAIQRADIRVSAELGYHTN